MVLALFDSLAKQGLDVPVQTLMIGQTAFVMNEKLLLEHARFEFLLFELSA